MPIFRCYDNLVMMTYNLAKIFSIWKQVTGILYDAKPVIVGGLWKIK